MQKTCQNRTGLFSVIADNHMIAAQIKSLQNSHKVGKVKYFNIFLLKIPKFVLMGRKMKKVLDKCGEKLYNIIL